jgi:HSP20 family protein
MDTKRRARERRSAEGSPERRRAMALERWRPRWGLAPWRPFRELARMEREMEDLWGRALGEWPAGGWAAAGGWAPAIDMIDRADEIVVRADLPGLEQKDVEVSLDQGVLTIRGDRKEEKEAKEEDYYCCERWAGAFGRSLTLPAGVEADKIKAVFRNGILEVHLPKTKEAKGKKVEIKVE